LINSEYQVHAYGIISFDFITHHISVKGLEQLKILKRQTILGNSTSEEITLMVNLLELYATTNPSKKNIQNWKKHLDFYFEIILKIHYNPDLVQEGLAVKNTHRYYFKVKQNRILLIHSRY
jgi:hypothetical protein